MKLYIMIVGTLFCLLSCNKVNIIDRKEGSISLPVVNNLALQRLSDSTLKLTWAIPSISSDFEQPVGVFVEVRRLNQSLGGVVEFSTTLADAPTEFTHQLPPKSEEEKDVKRKYRITVKLKGTTVRNDPNYSREVYSLGQTVPFDE